MGEGDETREKCSADGLARLLDRLSGVSESLREEELRRLEASTANASLVASARLYFRLPADPEDLTLGTEVGGYTIQERIGEGGMGVVYRAAQDIPKRQVALKTVHPSFVSPQFADRFRREVDVLAQLEHPNIVPIFEAGSHQNRKGGRLIPYFTMGLVRGQSIKDFVRQHTKSRPLILKLMVDILGAIQYAHDRGVVHRDLKPGNLMVTEDGRPIVLDFGLAQLAHERPFGQEASLPSGNASCLSGTPMYMSPELFQGKAVSIRAAKVADVYSLGVVLFELIAGCLPHARAEVVKFSELRQEILDEAPMRLAALSEDCPDELDAIVAKAIAKDPSNRYGSASDFAKAIVAHLQKGHAEVFLPSSGDSLPLRHWSPTKGAVIPPTRWKLVRRLGEGSVGEVWLTRHLDLGEERAVKFCRDPDRLRSLKREQAFLRLLGDRLPDSSRFAMIKDVSLDDPPYYLMIEYVEGRELHHWLEARGGIAATSEAQRLELIAQVAEALHQAHNLGIIHRDVKPSNILVRRAKSSGGFDRAVLSDFGIGKVVAESLLRQTQFQLTWTGGEDLALGSFMYVAPEVTEGGIPSVQSDIYSLGVLLFQMCVGNFGRSLPRDDLREVQDPLLRQDIERCVATRPEDRWLSAAEVAENLRGLGRRRTELEAAERELEALRKTAYWRGVIRAGLYASVVISALVALLSFGLLKSQEASLESSRATIQSDRASDATAEAKLDAAAAKRRTPLAGRGFGSLALIEEARQTAKYHPRILPELIESAMLTDFEEVAHPLPPPKGVTVTAMAPSVRASASVTTNGLITLQTILEDGSVLSTPVNEDRPDWKVEVLEFDIDSKRLVVAARTEGSLNVALVGVTSGAIELESKAVALGSVAGLDINGHIAALYDETGRIAVYDFVAGQWTTTEISPSGLVNDRRRCSSIRLRPGHEQLAVASFESLYVSILHQRTGRTLQRIALPWPSHDLAWDASGERLAVVGEDSTVTVFEPDALGKWTARASRTFPRLKPTALAFTKRADTIAVGGTSGAMVLWNLEDDSNVADWSSGQGPVQRILCSPTGTHIVAVDDKSERILRTNLAACYRTLRLQDVPHGRFHSVELGYDDRLAIVAHERGMTFVDLDSNRRIGGVTVPAFRGCYLDAADSRIIGFSSSGAHYWPVDLDVREQLEGGDPLTVLGGVSLGEVAAGPGRMAVAGNRERVTFVNAGKVRVFDLGHEGHPRLLQTLPVDPTVQSALLSHSGEIMVLSDSTQSTFYIAASEGYQNSDPVQSSLVNLGFVGQELCRFSIDAIDPIPHPTESPTWGDSGPKVVFDVNDDVKMAVVLDPAANRLALFDMQTRTRLLTFSVDIGVVEAIHLGRSGRVAAASNDGLLHIWDFADPFLQAVGHALRDSDVASIRRFNARGGSRPIQASISVDFETSERARKLDQLHTLELKLAQAPQDPALNADIARTLYELGQFTAALEIFTSLAVQYSSDLEVSGRAWAAVAKIYHAACLLEDRNLEFFDPVSAIRVLEPAGRVGSKIGFSFGETGHIAKVMAALATYWTALSPTATEKTRESQVAQATELVKESLELIKADGDHFFALKKLAEAACALEQGRNTDANQSYRLAITNWKNMLPEVQKVPSYLRLRDQLARNLNANLDE